MESLEAIGRREFILRLGVDVKKIKASLLPERALVEKLQLDEATAETTKIERHSAPRTWKVGDRWPDNVICWNCDSETGGRIVAFTSPRMEGNSFAVEAPACTFACASRLILENVLRPEDRWSYQKRLEKLATEQVGYKVSDIDPAPRRYDNVVYGGEMTVMEITEAKERIDKRIIDYAPESVKQNPRTVFGQSIWTMFGSDSDDGCNGESTHMNMNASSRSHVNSSDYTSNDFDDQNNNFDLDSRLQFDLSNITLEDLEM